MKPNGVAWGLTAAALAAALAAVPVSAQAPAVPVSAQAPVLPVRMVLQDRDRDRVPDRLGDTVTVEGVLTSDVQVVGLGASLLNFQDRTRGIILFSDAGLLDGLVRSDSVRATGVVGQYRGSEQIVVSSIERLGTGVVPAPRDVFAADLHRERFTGELVRVEGRMEGVRPHGDRVIAELRDRSGGIRVHVAAAWLADPAFARRLEAGGRVAVVGVVSQRSGREGGYELFPRASQDFDFPSRPPFVALAFAALIGIILALAWWRRGAVRRARELQALSGELERSRNGLRESEALLRSLVENAADTVSIVDAGGRIIYQSPSIERILGWSPAEMVQRPATDFFAEEDRPRFLTLLAILARLDGETREIELRARTRDGSWKRLELMATGRLSDPAVRGIVVNARDVTLHKALEERLRQADRLEVVGRLAGGIAHDFNNLLTALRGHAEVALEGMAEGAAARDEVREVVHAADRAAGLTRQLLAFSRQQVMKPRVVRAGDLIRGMEPLIRRLIGEDLELVITVPEEYPSIRVDPAQFEQVLMNLIVNARDALAGGGRLSVELAEADRDEVVPDQADAAADRWLRLSVSDTGTGMTEDVLMHIFEPFFTTKETGKGTGLGLATLYGIVTQSGGHVRARSEVGEGTRLDVYFPAIAGRPDAEPGAAPPTVAGPRTGAGEVILLVEDEPAVRKLARRILEKAGYEVLEAASPAEALAIVSAREEPFDLLLTDVVMPGMSGSDLARQLRAGQPTLPLLFISGYTDDEVIRRGIDRGETAFLEKPFTRAELLRAVQESLRPRRAIAT